MNKRILVVIIGLIVLAFGAGYLLSRQNEPEPSNTTPTVTENTTNPTSSGSVESAVSYTLPNGMEKAMCAGDEAVYIVPTGDPAECNQNPPAEISLSMDTGDTNDCNQLQNVSDVKKHTCISLFINGQKTLKASTEYLASSSYGKDLTINAYYLDTGDGVVKAEYAFEGDGRYQAEFDELVNSMKAK